MTAEPDYPFRLAMTEICRGVIDAVVDRPGASPAERSRHIQMVGDTMTSFTPRDPLETMLAGQCIVFDHVVRDAAHDLLSGQTQALKLRLRPQICAASKMFLENLKQFQASQASAAAKLGALATPQPAATPKSAPAAEASPRPAPARAEPTAATATTRQAARAEAVAKPAAAPHPPAQNANPAPPGRPSTQENTFDVQKVLAAALAGRDPGIADLDKMLDMQRKALAAAGIDVDALEAAPA